MESLYDFLENNTTFLIGETEGVLGPYSNYVNLLLYYKSTDVDGFITDLFQDIQTLQGLFTTHSFDLPYVNICPSWNGVFYNNLIVRHTITFERLVLRYLE